MFFLAPAGIVALLKMMALIAKKALNTLLKIYCEYKFSGDLAYAWAGVTASTKLRNKN